MRSYPPFRRTARKLRLPLAMRNAILMMLLTVASSSVAAERARVGGNETMIAYADFATIRENGNMAKTRTLVRNA
jgi:hypothetical protein